ncbi:MAG: hypothetical protein P8Z35_05305 [Ignavibacteriaceae bacterium]|jgi:hypothetical protein
MSYSKIYLALSFFILFLYLTGCNQNDSSVVSPTDDSAQLGRIMNGNESPVTQSAFINGDMEDNTNGYWKGGFSNNNYQFNYSNTEYVSPSHSLNIIASGSNNSFAYWAQTFKADSFIGRKISVTVSAKYQNVSGQGVMLVLRGDDTEQPEGNAEVFSTTQGKIVFDGTSDWETIEVDMDPVPKVIKSLTVYMLISATSGEVYFDNLGISSSEASTPVTTLVNGDMELGKYSPDNWWFGSADNSLFSFKWDTSEYLSANHSLKISSSNSGEKFSFWGQTISANELIGKKITLNVNIKTVNLDGQGVYIAIRGDDTNPPTGNAEVFATTQGKKQISGTFDWKKFNVTLDNVPSDIKSLTFYLIYGIKTSGSVYFDDASLTGE